MTTFAIACIQTGYDAGDNLAAMAHDVEMTVRRFPWVEMIVFPELAAFGPSRAAAQTLPGSAEIYLCALARKHGIWLVPGSLYEIAGDEIYNTACVIDPNGEVVGRYRKMYPFAPYEVGVVGGDRFLVFDVPEVGRFGISICYDMWFPETTRTLAWMGAEVILHPSLTNTIDRDAELAIARASATVNQCYFLDVNCGGKLGYGRSVMVGPESDVIYEAGRDAEIIPVIVDFDRVRRARREGLYGLGQPLKSFRDRDITFPPYTAGAHSSVLDSLGPLESRRRPDPT